MNLDWLNGFYILSGTATIISLIYAVIVAPRSDRRKILLFDFTSPLSLVTVIPDQTNHRLSILYEKEGAEPINIKGAYLYFIKVANRGKEPIRREDLVASDPLRLEVQNTVVLDMAAASVSRQVINFNLSAFQESDEDTTTALLSFDFLDHLDGALIRIITDSPSGSIQLRGTIIGMPAGIYHSNQAGGIVPSPSRFLLFLAGASVLSTGLTIIVTSLRGSITTWWGGVILILSFLIVLTVFVALLFLHLLSPECRWPATLKLPEWFKSEYRREKLSK